MHFCFCTGCCLPLLGLSQLLSGSDFHGDVLGGVLSKSIFIFTFSLSFPSFSSIEVARIPRQTSLHSSRKDSCQCQPAIQNEDGLYFGTSSSIVIQEQVAGYIETIWLLRYEVTISSDIRSSVVPILPPFPILLEPGRTPVAVRMDTIEDGSAHCEKVEAYCIRHEKQNERWASNRKDECGLHASDRRTGLPPLIDLPSSKECRKGEILGTIGMTICSTSDVKLMEGWKLANTRSGLSGRGFASFPRNKCHYFGKGKTLEFFGQKFFPSVQALGRLQGYLSGGITPRDAHDPMSILHFVTLSVKNE
ncbi:hypothetical protein F5141DRAFT_1064275 [Pisolithus sp. B1]|nr:hypothetical protein F5141DRAFT_1064275 [Pisolithus sp. B1]